LFRRGEAGIKVCQYRADHLSVTSPDWLSGACREPDAVPTLLSEYDSDPPANRKRLRELLASDPARFLGSVRDVLKRDHSSRGAQFAVSLLVSNNLIVPCLSDTSLSDMEALGIAQTAIQVEPMADVTIARALTDLVQRDASVKFESAARLIRILESISDGSRLSPILARLLTHPNPALRSKAVLMMGRNSKSVKWVRHRLADPDARTRANALEALWGVDTVEARDLLRRMVDDPNNRVAGNAIVGLHRLGDCAMIPRIYEMAGHSSAPFRSTAAWIMGTCGDLRFLEVLGGMLRDSSPMVRRRAFSALGGLRARGAAAARGAPFVITGRFLETANALSRRLAISVVQPGNRFEPVFLPTQFALSEDGQPVTSYRVTSQNVGEVLVVVIVMPREASEAAARWREAMPQCLAWKRSQDWWACMPYMPGTPPSSGSGEAEAPQFYCSSERLAVEFGRVGWQAGGSDLWRAVRRAIQVDLGAVKGRRHLIILNDAESHATPDEGLAKALQAARATVQVVSTVSCEPLQTFCGAVNGSYWGTECGSAPDVLRSAYLNLLARYEILYDRVSLKSQTLKLRAWNAEACGEMAIQIH
jgi:HEAT repeats